MKPLSIFKKKIAALALTTFVCMGTLSKSQAQIMPVFNHFAICVKDLKVSVPFYADVIGLKKIKHPFADTVHQWFSLGGKTQLHVIQANCPTIVHDINIHLCLSVPSIDDYIKHLDQLNVKWGDWTGNRHPQKRPDGVLQIYLQDPDGYWIEINNAK